MRLITQQGGPHIWIVYCGNTDCQNHLILNEEDGKAEDGRTLYRPLTAEDAEIAAALKGFKRFSCPECSNDEIEQVERMLKQNRT